MESIAKAMSRGNIETFALFYLGIDSDVLSTLKDEHANNTSAYKRAILSTGLKNMKLMGEEDATFDLKKAFHSKLLEASSSMSLIDSFKVEVAFGKI